MRSSDTPQRSRWGSCTRRMLAAGALCALVACVSFPDTRGGPAWPRPEQGAVASEHPLATSVGLSILDRGGNAVDAAVATAFALAVVYPQAGNLGGGGFAIYAPHEGDPLALDFRETAPALLTSGAFVEDGKLVRERALTSHLASGVPGSPAGLHALHRELGRLPFSEVLRPAIRLARSGFAVDPWLAYHLRRPAYRARLEKNAAARALFYPGGEPLAEGALLRQPDLANTLDQLAKKGPRGFYSGSVALRIAEEMERGGGAMSETDLLAYEPVWREPLRGWFRGMEVITMPPPSSGGIVLLQVLGILDGFPLEAERTRALTALGEADERGTAPPAVDEVGLSDRSLHWWIEAMRRAFADRAEHMGDPDYHPVPTEELLEPDWIAERRISIGERADPKVGAWIATVPDRGRETTHLCVLDSDGNAVSLTTTLNAMFGNGVLVEGAGFLLNNEMDDFALLPGVANEFGLVGSRANALQPGKRPLSSMTPTVLREGGQAVTFVLGSPGGPRIITSVIEVLLRTLVYEQPLMDAVRAPRLHQQWKPEHTYVEPGWTPQILAGLRNRGHDLVESAETWSSVQAIWLEPGGAPIAYSDPRRGGAAGIQGGRTAHPARPPRGEPPAGAPPAE